MSRKFWLVNEYGEQKCLTDDNLSFSEPEGLGLSELREYEQTEPGFFEITDDKTEQPLPAGKLVFKQNAYEQYRDFMDWIANAKELKFMYRPYGTVDYFMDVKLDLADKRELNGVRWLEVDMKIAGLTPWYSRNRLVFEFTEVPEENFKQYEYIYPYRYGVSGTPGSLDFRIRGHYPGGVSLYAQGPIAAPVLTLTNTDTKEVYGMLDLSAITINEDEQLIYSSRVRSCGVWRQKNGELTDLMDQVELYAGVPIFMRAPTNTPLTATLSVENIITTQSTLYVDEYWKTR